MYNILLSTHAYADNSKAPVILVLGDSISAAYGINTEQGWVSLLQTRLTTMGINYRVINASVSGDTTRTGLNRLKPLLQQHHPKIVIVALGGNDGLRGLAFTEIKSSLSNIINLIQKFDSKAILVGVRLPPNYGAAYNKKFTSIYQNVAKQFKIPLVLNLLSNVDEKSELMQADGIHPKAPAQAQMLENIWVKLKLLISRT